jgi:hypothetical protein
MRGTYGEIAEYLAGVAALLERFGATLRLPVGADFELLEDRSGELSFELLGDLPDGADPARAEIAVREAFRPVGVGRYERTLYEYELVDRERDYRRALHLHFPKWFQRRYLVVVHEHCERPVGRAECEHYEGTPIKDAYAGVVALMGIWTGPTPDCSTLRCLG